MLSIFYQGQAKRKLESRLLKHSTKGIWRLMQNLAQRFVLLKAGVSLHKVTTMNSARLPLVSHAEGIYSNSSPTPANRIIVPQDSISALGSTVHISSLSKLSQSDSTECEKMDAPACTVQAPLESDIDRMAMVLEQREAFEEPQAELCASGANCVTAEELGSVAALSEWLKDRLPSGSLQVEQWGIIPGTKTMANLWIELLQGEISLEDSRPPKRTVHVATIKIKNETGKMLLEARQEMTDGSIRERNRPLSEKIKPGENIQDACVRGIYEELGSELAAPEKVVMLWDSYKKEVQERESFSYPGLMTCYVLHSVEAIVTQLPDNDFITVEDEVYDSNGAQTSFSSIQISGEANSKLMQIAIGVKRHFWKWVQDTS